jgi:hypothetical protein
MESVAATAEAGPSAAQQPPPTDYDRVATPVGEKQH